jgi:dihydrofolate synthase/folylpolyglutamate synthase
VLSTFLDAKPLFYEKIDYERMPRVYTSIKEQLKLPKIIHLVGTNAKGTTGRFLATALFSAGYSVGHYTSPHIITFNERVWLNGALVEDEALEEAHLALLLLLSKEDADALSYFEYTTLLAIYLYQEYDYIVLEAGLGGEYDATAVFENILTVVTPIDRDHEAFLGNSIEAIAKTKLNAIQKRVVFAKQKHEIVYSVGDDLSKERGFDLFRYETLLEHEDKKNIEKLSRLHTLPLYLQENISVAISVLNLLNIPYSSESFEKSRLYGRLTQIAPNIIIDVGHNVLAANAIVSALKDEKFILVYNSYKDKNYREILSTLKSIIKEVELISVDDTRIENREDILDTLDSLTIPHSLFKGIKEDKNYLVFGSFSVVEAFLRQKN